MSINKRRFFHASLIVFIILLQCLVLLFWYLETKNDEKIAKISTDIRNLGKAQSYSGESHNLLIRSQILYKDYLRTKNQQSLTDYLTTINELNAAVGSLNLILQDNFPLENKTELLQLRNKLDTIVKETPFMDKGELNDVVMKKFNSQEILNSMSMDSIITRDSIARKSFFSRIFDAISGKYDIQKERLEIIASYKYNNKVNSGEIKAQIEKILKDSDAYYKSQINALKESFGTSNANDSKLYDINNRLLTSASGLISSYNNIIQPLMEDSHANFSEAAKNNSSQRNYLIFALALVTLIFSIILFKFTLYAFDLEKRLIASQEQITKNLEYKNKIIGMVSHEVRSPLSIISLYCKMIVDKIKDSEIREVFHSVQNTTSTLLLLTNQILDYTKNENSKMKLNKSKFYLKDELHNIMEPLDKLCVQNSNRLQWDNSVSENNLIFSDIIKINQLFYNLVGNALKFTKDGTISITTKTENKNSGILNFYVTVGDTGAGISQEDVKHVFEDYYQGSNGMASMGIGLGLKLCKEIVQLFDGEISIQSEVNEGTTVSFMLQLELDE